MQPKSKPSPEIIRKSFGLKEQISPELKASYHSSLIEEMKANGFCLKRGRMTFHLAQEFGFCYGVDRAIEYAYETKSKFKDRRIFLTNEIIHNPRVNAKLQELGIRFLSGPYADGQSLADVREEDVVLMPAFGTTVDELAQLQKRGCVIVDTTCGSVMSVWKRVEAYSRDGFTSVIHGKYNHEETRATSSRAVQYPEGRYVVVRDKAQTLQVCDFILGRGDRQAFLAEFAPAVSEGFDPDRHLEKIGCANQTTMLSSESLEIANMLQAAIKERYGKDEAAKRFRHFDTICSATQERQDAIYELVKKNMDLMVVIGGFNSSNTGHLAEISSEYCPAYHINDTACLISKDLIRHKKNFSNEILQTQGWLPEGPVHIGLTAGASTPNRMIEEAVQRILSLDQG